jgi:hypothetical protein
VLFKSLEEEMFSGVICKILVGFLLCPFLPWLMALWVRFIVSLEKQQPQGLKSRGLNCLKIKVKLCS